MRMSRFLSIYIVNISNDPDSPRPAIVMQFVKPKEEFKTLEITHVNPNDRSNRSTKNYYHLKEWNQENLKYNSWVKIDKLEAVPATDIINHRPIGSLTSLDETELFKAMMNYFRLP